MTQPTTQAIQRARAFAVIDPHWGEPRIMLDTIRSTREQALEDALWNRELSLYSGAVLDRVPAIKGQWERLERQHFKVEEVSIDALSAAASEREQLEAAARDVISSASDTYKKRNGHVASLEGDDGEKCWIVPFDQFEQLRAALEIKP